jgi:hypothetical protein
MVNRKPGTSKKNLPSKRALTKNEIELKNKEKQLKAAKAKYQKLAKEYIDIWVKTKRARRGLI